MKPIFPLILVALAAPAAARGQYVLASGQNQQMSYQQPMQAAYAPAQGVYAGQPAVLAPGHFGRMAGHLGRKLEMLSWPRVEPIRVPIQQQTTGYLYVVVQPQTAPMVQAAVYQQVAALPPLPPQQYASPQAPQYTAPPPQQYGSPQFRADQAPQGQQQSGGGPQLRNEQAPPAPAAPEKPSSSFPGPVGADKKE
jgi:hypothetical protein